MMASAWVHSGEGPLPDCRLPTSHCPHMVEGARDLSGASFIKALILFRKALPPKIPSPCRLGFQHMNYRGIQTFKPSQTIRTKISSWYVVNSSQNVWATKMFKRIKDYVIYSKMRHLRNQIWLKVIIMKTDAIWKMLIMWHSVKKD